MPAEASNPVLVFSATAGLLSMAALFFLFQKRIDGQSLLAYESRRRVPWSLIVALFAISIPLLNIILFFLGTSEEFLGASEETPTLELTTQELLVKGWINFSFMVLFVPSVMIWLVAFFRADSRDLALPTNWKQLASDLKLGVFAAVATLLPIYVVQLVLIYTLKSETSHPIVEQLQEHQSAHMFLIGFLMAVVAAPLFEEFTFRVLLQGWLERYEDETLNYQATQRRTVFETSPDSIDGPITLNLEMLTQPDDEAPIASRPIQGLIPFLPHGWTPILISAFLFGLAHLGHGVAPIPLVLFGVVLGYLYQRTHRLAPSIAAHMTFNAYSMILLWLQLDSLPPS